MSENSNPQSQTTGSGISVDKNTGNLEVAGTVTLSRQSVGRPRGGQPPSPEKTAPRHNSKFQKCLIPWRPTKILPVQNAVTNLTSLLIFITRLQNAQVANVYL